MAVIPGNLPEAVAAPRRYALAFARDCRTGLWRFERPIVIANVEHRFIVAEQLRGVGREPPRVVLEPMGKNTAPAIGAGAVLALREDSEATILVVPADHVIGDLVAFQAAVDSGLAA